MKNNPFLGGFAVGFVVAAVLVFVLAYSNGGRLLNGPKTDDLGGICLPPNGGVFPGATACPEDAKLCSDGSSVGRVGPDCKFALCPGQDPGLTPEPIPEQSQMCTMEARQCPDGKYVGRTGPNCEFSPCAGE